MLFAFPVDPAGDRDRGRSSARASTNAMIAIAVVYIPIFARDHAGQRAPRPRGGLRARGASRSGVPDRASCGRHLLPNVAGPIIVQTSLSASASRSCRRPRCRSSASASSRRSRHGALMLSDGAGLHQSGLVDGGLPRSWRSCSPWCSLQPPGRRAARRARSAAALAHLAARGPCHDRTRCSRCATCGSRAHPARPGVDRQRGLPTSVDARRARSRSSASRAAARRMSAAGALTRPDARPRWTSSGCGSTARHRSGAMRRPASAGSVRGAGIVGSSSRIR